MTQRFSKYWFVQSPDVRHHGLLIFKIVRVTTHRDVPSQNAPIGHIIIEKSALFRKINLKGDLATYYVACLLPVTNPLFEA